MRTLNIVDLNQVEELSHSKMAGIVGGHDYNRDNAIVEALNFIRKMDAENNAPEPAIKVSMHLPG